VSTELLYTLALVLCYPDSLELLQELEARLVDSAVFVGITFAHKRKSRIKHNKLIRRLVGWAVGSLYRHRLAKLQRGHAIPSDIADMKKALELLIALRTHLTLRLSTSLLDLMVQGCRSIASSDKRSDLTSVFKLQRRLANLIIHQISTENLNTQPISADLAVRLTAAMAAWAKIAGSEPPTHPSPAGQRGTDFRQQHDDKSDKSREAETGEANIDVDSAFTTLSHRICELISLKLESWIGSPSVTGHSWLEGFNGHWASPAQLGTLLANLGSVRCDDSKLIVLRHRLQGLVQGLSPTMAVNLLRLLVDAGAVQQSEALKMSSAGVTHGFRSGGRGRHVISSALMHGRMLGSIARLLGDRAGELTPRQVKSANVGRESDISFLGSWFIP